MALPSLIQAAIDRIRAANGNAYDPDTNPGGLAQGGHRQNFVPDLNAVADISGFVADRAIASDINAALTAEDASNTSQDRIATSQDRTASAGSAQAAAASAAGVNLPPLSPANAGKFLAVKSDGSGYDPVTVPAPSTATKAEAETGTNNTKMMTPLRTAEAIAATGGSVSYQVFTSSGTFTKDADDIAYWVECIGGGGGGGFRGFINQASGGGGGECAMKLVLAADVTSSFAVTVGAGATARATTEGQGNNGGNSTFGSYLTGRGGMGGYISSPTHGSSGGGALINQNGDLSGGGGGYAANGGSSSKGGGGGGSSNPGAQYLGGTSALAGAGGNGGTSSIAPTSGSIPGGGGGASGNVVPGAGARGEVRIWRIKK